jgi:hypothetical protein
MLAEEEQKAQCVPPGFTAIRDFIERTKIYGVPEHLILDAIKAGLVDAYEFTAEHRMQVLAVSGDIDCLNCYVKESYVDECIQQLPKMVPIVKQQCCWISEHDHFKTLVEPCTIYIPTIVYYHPYLPQRVIDSAIIECTCRLSEVDDVVFRTEHDKEHALLYYDFPPYILDTWDDELVSQMKTGSYAAFELLIRPRNISLAKRHQYYPVRYVQMILPDTIE